MYLDIRGTYRVAFVKICPVNANSGWQKPLGNKILILLANVIIVNIYYSSV